MTCAKLSHRSIAHPAYDHAFISALTSRAQAAVRNATSAATAELFICASCTKQLELGKPPPDALLFVDTGAAPAHLTTLTYAEKRLLAPLRPNRNVYIGGAGARIMQGHMVAIPGPPPAALAGAFPCPLDEVPKTISVVMLRAAANPAHAKQLADGMKALAMNGPGLVAWARHLRDAYAAQDHLRNFTLANDAVLGAYSTVSGAPLPQVTDNTTFWSDAPVAAAMSSAFMGGRDGYAKQRYGSDADPSRPDAADAEEDAPPARRARMEAGDMQGLDSADRVLSVSDPTGEALDDVAAEMRQSGRGLVDILSNGGRLLSSTTNGRPANDYKSEFWFGAHPTVFPWGVGGKPDGMSLEHWLRLLLNRYPRSQFAMDTGFQFDARDVMARHEVRRQASIQMTMTPDMVRAAQDLDEGQLQIAAEFVKYERRGPEWRAALAAAPPGVQAVVKSAETAGQRCLASAKHCARLRSQVVGDWHLTGPFTFAVNINPADLEHVLSLVCAGVNLLTREDGSPYLARDGGLSSDDRWRIITGDSDAAAYYFAVVMDCFADVILCWPKGAIRQDVDRALRRVARVSRTLRVCASWML